MWTLTRYMSLKDGFICEGSADAYTDMTETEFELVTTSCSSDEDGTSPSTNVSTRNDIQELETVKAPRDSGNVTWL